MCVIVKTRCFYSFTINLKIITEKVSTLFLRHLPRKIRYQIWQGFIVGFFVKSYYLNLNFFSCTVRCSPDASHPKNAWHSKKQKKKIEKRERKVKNEKKWNKSNKCFLLLILFYIEKFIKIIFKIKFILWKNMFEKT